MRPHPAAPPAGDGPGRILPAVLAVAVLVCAGGGPPPAGAAGAPADLPPAAALRAPDLDLRAMLLVMQERRVYEPVTVLEALKGGPQLRAELAVALGRTPDAAGRPVLEGLLIDDQPEVRREAAFGLGLLGDPEARPALLRAVRDPDRETGALAVEALGRLDTPVLAVGEQLLPLADDERWARLLPYLFRFKDEARLPLAEHGLGLADAELHRCAAYALAREPLPAAAPLLRRLVADPDPLVRAWAVRGLGRVGGTADLAALAPLLGDGAAGTVIEALRAGAALAGAAAVPARVAGEAAAADVPGDGGAGAAADTARAAAAAGWRPRLLALLADPRPGVRTSAIEAAGSWLPDPELGAALAALAAAPGAPAAPTLRPEAGKALPSGAVAATPAVAPASAAPPAAGVIERALAVVALARGRDPRAAALAAAAAGTAEPLLRARAAEAAGFLGDHALLARLAGDRSPLVREAVLSARLPAAPRPAAAAGVAGGPSGFSETAERAAASVAAAALADPDEGVRATVCEWLAGHPVVQFAKLAGAAAAALRDESIESPLGVIKALAARALAEPRERGAVVELLERLDAQTSYVLRRAAAAALVRLGRPQPPLGPAASGQPGQIAERLETYREIVERTRRPRTVEIRTSRGAFRVRLDCPRAPRTCLNFLDLAGQRFYDGLLFHRVVPDFVIQAGDPRGDGFGGPGYILRDELSRVRYRRGIVGMALAGPDTGGSQFFVTLAPQPHLDGGFTAFGEVVAGDAVLDAIQAGDRIETIVELP